MSKPSRDTEARQRLRMQRFMMSVTLYALWAVVTGSAWLLNLIGTPAWVLTSLGVGAIVSVIGFWSAFATGFNLRFKDPSLTLAQCGVGLSWLMLLMYVVPEWRDLLLAVFLIVLMFGTFQLRPRQFAGLAFAAFVGYVTMSGIDLAAGNETLSQVVFRAVVVGSLMIWCAYFGIHVSGLRDALYTRNEQLETMVREVSHLAERDDLTQAYNRRAIIETLGRLREASLRYGEPFSIVIVDLDYFKQVNDRFGHMVGDRVLADFSNRIRAELRLLDEIEPVVDDRRLGRYGGEEFILILPRTRLAGAQQCAERVRGVTAGHGFGSGISITVSAGVAEFSGAEPIDTLLRRADMALYSAKAAGRNCVRSIAADGSTNADRGSDVVNLSDYKNDR
ncbi:MAG: GGDEF domain-containing protein [Pseudomonadota bacterium]